MALSDSFFHLRVLYSKTYALQFWVIALYSHLLAHNNKKRLITVPMLIQHVLLEMTLLITSCS